MTTPVARNVEEIAALEAERGRQMPRAGRLSLLIEDCGRV